MNYHAHWDWDALRGRALREASRVLDCPHDAEDAVQEALIRAWRMRDRCTGRPAAWVGTIAQREALRHKGRTRPIPVEEVPETSPAWLEHDLVDERLTVRDALNRLSTSDRCALTLCYGADLTAAQAARATGSTESTVRVRLHRARKRLGAVLEE